MLRLVSKLLTLGLLIALTVAMIIVITPHDTSNYLAAARDKHRLLYSVKSPRIILVGGSNVAFSIDSEKIEKRFGIPVINVGLHGDLGLRFMLNEIEPAVNKGDIVLIFPEYEEFYEISLDGLPRELGSVIKFCPECVSAISTPRQAFNAVTGILQTEEGDLLRMVRKPEKPEKVYTRLGFDQWGDLVSHLQRPDKQRPNNHVYEIKLESSAPATDLLNTFARSPNVVKAQVYMMYPAIPLDEYHAQQENFTKLNDLLQSELLIPILGTPQDFIYPEEFFYDTVYHMNAAGRIARTDQIIKLLSTVLQD